MNASRDGRIARFARYPFPRPRIAAVMRFEFISAAPPKTMGLIRYSIVIALLLELGCGGSESPPPKTNGLTTIPEPKTQNAEPTSVSANWQFDDPPNAASFTTSFVLDGAPVLRVYHDYDGGWQFHGSPDDPTDEDVARVVSLESMISRDATLHELHDLPHGWRATRTSEDSPWTRDKNHSFPTYAENGYYLEDAVWMAQYRDDVHPPPEDVRKNLAVGAYVKLLFRFAPEDAERADGQTERMWVLLTEFDEDENYVGVLENDPHHADTLVAGDRIRFHPLHVVEVLDADGA